MSVEQFGDDLPLLSIVVLNYNRRDALAKCLDAVLRQDYTKREVIVVDNHSEENIENLVAECGPSVRLIRLSENFGSCTGRNVGIRAARGEILVMIDNDVVLASQFELTEIVKAFNECAAAGVLAFQICDVDSGKPRAREWCHPRDMHEFWQKKFETCFFGEGASAFRREVFEAAGMYYEPLFIGCEGHDLALRIAESGFRIFYTPRVRVYHLMSPETRQSDRPFYFYTRNYIWIARKDYSLFQGLRFAAPKLLMMLYFSVRSGYPKAYLRGLRDGLRGLAMVSRVRAPIGRATISRIRELERWRPTIWTRFNRHREVVQI